MNVDDEYVKRFPNILKRALESKKIHFPSNTEDKYADEAVFRGIRLLTSDLPINLTHFYSQMENAVPFIDVNDIGNYGCSVQSSIDELKAALKLPRKNWCVAKGIIKSELGPISRSANDSHILWFLFKDTNPECYFEVYDYEKNMGKK